MNGLVGTGVVGKSMIGKGLTFAAVAGVAVFGLAGLANAGDNCDSYAKLTLQQAKQNIDRGCGFTGPAWSLDASKHRAWCKDVGPGKWRPQLKLRSKKLTTECK